MKWTTYSRYSLMTVVAKLSSIASVRGRNCVSSRVFISKTNTPSRVTQVQRGINEFRELHARKWRAPLSAFPLLLERSRERSPVAIATRKTARRRLARAPLGPARCLGSFSRLVIEAWKVSRPLCGCRVTPGARPKSTYMLKQLRRRTRRRENDEERHGEISGVRRRIDARAHTHATSLLSRRHSRHASRFISFFALEKAYFSGIRLRSSLGVRKRARPSRVLFNLAYTAAAPLRSAARRYVLLLQRGKAVLGESSLSDRSTENRAV